MPASAARPVSRLPAALQHWRQLLHWPTASLRAYFMAVIMVATVPMTGLASYLISNEILAARSQLESGLKRTAASLALTVEREIVSSIDALNILSFSESLQRDDISGFFSALASLPKLRNTWSSAYLVELNGDVLFNTHQPADKPLGKMVDAAALERLKRTGQPVLTQLIAGPDGQPVTSILVPVQIKGQLRYALGAWISPASWEKLMASVTVAPGGFVTIFDADHRLIAHYGGFRDEASDAAPSLRQNGVRIERSTQSDGPDVYGAWQPVPIAGWGVGIGVPAAPIDRLHLVAVATAFGAGLLSLATGLALALLVARRVTTPLRDLAVAGAAPSGRSSEVRELSLLQQALQSSEAQRESARERLQAKANEFEAMFQSSPIGLAIAQDPDCRNVLRNPALTAMFGSDPQHDLSRHRVLHRGQPLSEDEQPLKFAARTGARVRDIELEVIDAVGRSRQLIAHAVPLLDSQGRPRGAIGAYTDITERKQAEESLVNAERRLRESQHLVELAQEAGHVGFFDRRFDTDEVTSSAGLARLFGMSLTDLEGPWRAWLERIEAEDRAAVAQRIDEAISQGTEKTTVEFRVRHPTGAEHWLSCRVLLTYDLAHQPQHMIGVVVDVTPQKAVERERAALVATEQAARLEAEKANRAKDEFLAMLGHELRNPLGAISAASEVLNRLDPEHAAAVSARKIIARQTRHLARLMDDLLDVARVIAGKIMLSPRPLDLADATRRLLGTLEVTGALANHHLTQNLSEAWVQADSVRLEQIINNLVTNALKYTPDGGHITVSVRAEGPWAVLRVEDTGGGMSPELLATVFDLFVQGERTLDRRQGGLGIGLTLVRRLAELHGGTVSAHSDGLQQGSVFTVRLPLIQIEAPVAPPAPSIAGGARHVVVVEDNDDAREALCTMLELAGHSVRWAADGEAGLKLALATHPEVALIDIGLPLLPGYEVARQLRKAGHGGVLIAVSGYGQPKDVEQAKAVGFDHHLVKPVDPQVLLALVAGALSPAPALP